MKHSLRWICFVWAPLAVIIAVIIAIVGLIARPHSPDRGTTQQPMTLWEIANSYSYPGADQQLLPISDGLGIVVMKLSTDDTFNVVRDWYRLRMFGYVSEKEIEMGRHVAGSFSMMCEQSYDKVLMKPRPVRLLMLEQRDRSRPYHIVVVISQATSETRTFISMTVSRQ